jgi:hypothetical protein
VRHQLERSQQRQAVTAPRTLLEIRRSCRSTFTSPCPSRVDNLYLKNPTSRARSRHLHRPRSAPRPWPPDQHAVRHAQWQTPSTPSCPTSSTALPDFAGRDVRIQQSLPPWCAEQKEATWVIGMSTVHMNGASLLIYSTGICCSTRQKREMTW